MSIVVLMLMTAIAVTSGTAAMALYYKYRQGVQSVPKLPSKTATRHTTNLRPNDVVEWLGDTFVVQTAFTLAEGSSRRAYLYLLNRGDSEGPAQWLHVAPNTPPLLAMLTHSDELSIPPAPPSQVTHHGASYKLNTWSQYTATCHGDPFPLQDDRTELYTYHGPSEHVLVAWIHGSEVYTLEGRAIEDHHMTLLPGDEITPEDA